MSEEHYERIMRVIEDVMGEVCEIPREKIVPVATLDELGIDSLDRMDIEFMLKQELALRPGTAPTANALGPETTIEALVAWAESSWPRPAL